MKKAFVAALITSVLTVPLAAQAEGFYLGANAGRSEQKLDVDGLGSFKDNDTGFKLYGGVGLTQNFGAEFGYVELGKGSAEIGGFPFNSKPTAIYIAVTGNLPIGDQFALTAKAGVAANRTKLSSPFGSSTETETTGIFGVGATYAATENVSVVVEYENFGKMVKEGGSNLKGNMLSVGLRYQF